MSYTHLRSLIALSEAVISSCSAQDIAIQPLSCRDPDLKLHHPPLSILVPEDLAHELDNEIYEKICQRLEINLDNARRLTTKAYRETAEQLGSVEQFGGIDDRQALNQLRKSFESSYSSHCWKAARAVRQALQRFAAQNDTIGRRPISFTPQTLRLLEAAYSRTKLLSTAETAIVAEAAGITPHQVRTWFQNKRNRGDKRQQASAHAQARKIQGLPKRAQPQPQLQPSIKLEPASALPGRKVRGLPRRAQVSHNAPQLPLFGDGSYSDTSSINNDAHADSDGHENGGRMNRSPSLTSTASNSTEIANGGFTSPYETMLSQGNDAPSISLEWGQGMLNIPMEMLQGDGGKVPSFNFTPPSPLKMNFNQVFDPSQYTNNQPMFGGQMYDTPTEETQHPFMYPQTELSGLESIESLLQSALSDPSSFDQFPTLATSPQFSLDSLSPQSDIPSLAPTSNATSPGWASSGEVDGLNGNFFQALEGMLAQQGLSPVPESALDLGEGGSAGPSRSVSMSSLTGYGSGAEFVPSNAGEILDISQIAAIPLPPSPSKSSFDANSTSNGYLTTSQLDESMYMGSMEDTTDFLNSGMCTPSSETSVYPLVTPTTNTESLVEVDQSQWNWMGGALPFDMVGMEVEMMEFGDTKMDQWSSAGGAREIVAA
ncbi:uncharacterized protein I303_104918 [Kwoniella dejecticola CBS 10117]|uniref:Homeobox domain-containing protein n=1 Tax=Kwoniella dejecticola CBS 10117 TaxID=1296121 RepID=A0A1A6A3Z6_9TREE|nr:uncharacterized protein I303_05636 [Kwoniella dejecticola CBS 10117]OBR84777.1 hypothetical protein I303_05636 [Kwoniella dejecticola CBS 10117]